MVIGSGEGETPPLSDYVLRYVLALLMNLSLRRCGREACLGVGPLLLRSLGELLEHEDEEVRVQTLFYKYSLGSKVIRKDFLSGSGNEAKCVAHCTLYNYVIGRG